MFFEYLGYIFNILDFLYYTMRQEKKTYQLNRWQYKEIRNAKPYSRFLLETEFLCLKISLPAMKVTYLFLSENQV